MKKFPTYKQLDEKDCGPTCLRIVSKYYKKNFSLKTLNELSETTREGTTLLNLSDAAEKLGYRTIGLKLTFSELLSRINLPCIVHWENKHFVVVYKIKKDKVSVSDPAFGLISYPKREFINHWVGENSEEKAGIVLMLDPSPSFYENEDEKSEAGSDFAYISSYLRKYKAVFLQIFLSLLFGSLLQLIFPFLTQSIIDVGIQNKNIDFINIILIAQLFLFLGRQGIEIVRNWILVNISARINISLVSDFFIKLFNLPISYFDSKRTGDILERINDNSRIQQLLTSTSINVLFSILNLLIFGGVLIYYNVDIFLYFFFGSFAYLLWVFLFLKKRKEIDYKRFSYVSKEKSKIIEFINGMQEIKLHNAEKLKRWNWETLQVKLFNLSLKNIIIEQFQTSGSLIINELKNIFITYYSAKLVIDGEITLGMMLSISYIIGQLNSPVGQLVDFTHSIQNAKIGLERLREILNKEDEDSNLIGINSIPENSSIHLKNLSFKYTGSEKEVLSKIDLTIPSNKVTAIVGESGCGKTTLLKILLNYYDIKNGEVSISGVRLQNISKSDWRKKCGVVMQEGYIFSGTISENIALGDDRIDRLKLQKASQVANIEDFINSLPHGYLTEIGNDGLGLSTGQKQRLLIARAVYKNPEFIFFDEATSALDANNESKIMENLNLFFKNKTVVVIAHRLSTVKNADQIVVMEQGKIVELGSHSELINLKGRYFNLVKNQLTLEKISS
ncbi:peptidase domain-containing ABC transporter [Echinicola marina]|uniref:peptidase domain-containing ABC transporter n=1 Tax=Echinicola marina TaxID=2859768 RepID=UPI001CF64DF3|nr:peptidase domain-containing ABC transporter [Echinicola marina]UCS92397.1 peptidase domain-containing ABC transporter [Echinicola marina]